VVDDKTCPLLDGLPNAGSYEVASHPNVPSPRLFSRFPEDPFTKALEDAPFIFDGPTILPANVNAVDPVTSPVCVAFVTNELY
jgi:hypothetical protein